MTPPPPREPSPAVPSPAEPVKVALDPQGRGRQFLARAIGRIAGTRLGGYALEAQREGPPTKPVMLYRLRRTDEERA
jgi:hypothetical protein